MKTLTEEQAFDAMILYMEKWFRRSEQTELIDVLSASNSAYYGTTSDPAAFGEWQECLDEVTRKQVEAAE